MRKLLVALAVIGALSASVPATSTGGGGRRGVTGDVGVRANGRQSIVAHLDSAGNPTITAYLDDDSPVPAGDARAIIRHTAAAPPVDVSFNDNVVAPALAEPGSAR